MNALAATTAEATSPSTREEADLIQALVDLGAIGPVAEDAAPVSGGKLLAITTRALRGLRQQVASARLQRDFCAEGSGGWHWRWNLMTGRLLIESSSQEASRRRHYEYRDWNDIVHPEDADALSRFGPPGFDSLVLDLRIRDSGGGWRLMSWHGAVVARDASGQASAAAGVLLLPNRGVAADTASSQQHLSMLANISHEVRTPMTAILGAACLAMDSNDPLQLKSLVQTIRTSAESLVSLLDDTLDFTKLEAGMLQIEEIEFDLYSLVADLARIHGLNAQRKKLTFLSEIAPGTPRMLVSDPTRIRQIVSNLLSNAVKFTEFGEVGLCVGIDTLPALVGPSRLIISVRDSGVGLSSERVNRLFSEYSQADVSIARTHGGTGLGLFICKRLAGLLDGDISVESVAGRGSVFEVSIPVVAVGGETRSSAADGRKVILCESNPAQREIVEGMLSNLGFSPVCVGEEELVETVAREMCGGSSQVDAILVDSTAVATLVELGGKIDSEGPLLIVMQDLASTQWETMATGRGMLHLLRPFSSDDLEAVLRHVRQDAHVSTDILDEPDIQEIGVPVAESRRILLAEDNPMSRDVLATMLRRVGYEVTEVTNGAEALEAFQREPFAYCIALLDIQMPVMDGFTAAEEIRGLEERRSWVTNEDWYMTPILATTADAHKSVVRLSEEAGMNGVLVKPITPEALLSAIERAIADARRASGMEGVNSALPISAPRAAGGVEEKLQALAALQTRIGTTQLNLDVALRWTAHDPDAVKRLVGSFLAEAPPAIEMLGQWVERRRLNESARLAHQVISSLDVLGATETSRLLREFYECCRSENHAGAQSAFARLRSSMVLLIELLTEVDALV